MLRERQGCHQALGIEDPLLLHDILSLLADNVSAYGCYQIENGSQIIQCFDSWAGQIDDDIYSQFAIPYQRKVIAALKATNPNTPVIIYMAPGKYSSKGRRLSQLAESGADIVSIDHTVDFSNARAVIPSDVGIQGNLDPKILRDGPLDKIQRETERILSEATGTRFIMNLGHGIEKDTPESNAAFFVRTVQAPQ